MPSSARDQRGRLPDRRAVVDHRWRQPGPDHLRSTVRRAVWCRTDPRVEWRNQPAPALSRRGPASQPGLAHHRADPARALPPHPRLPRPTRPTTIVYQRHSPLLETLHRPRGLQGPDQHKHRSKPTIASRLTNHRSIPSALRSPHGVDGVVRGSLRSSLVPRCDAHSPLTTRLHDDRRQMPSATPARSRTPPRTP